MIHIETKLYGNKKTFETKKKLCSFVLLLVLYEKSQLKETVSKSGVSDIWNTIVWRHTYISSLHLWMFQFLFVTQLLQKREQFQQKVSHQHRCTVGKIFYQRTFGIFLLIFIHCDQHLCQKFFWCTWNVCSSVNASFFQGFAIFT